jgi:hypothetical protein
MDNKELSAQEIYDSFYMEAIESARSKGHQLPDEIEIFEVFLKACKNAIITGDAPPDFLDEVAEIQSYRLRDVLEERRKFEVDQALRQGNILDLNALLK